MKKSIIQFNAVLDCFRFAVPEETRFIRFDREKSDTLFHIFFPIEKNEYRFTIVHSHEEGTAEELVTQSYAINAPFSNPDWCITPCQLENAQLGGWACGYGLMEGECLRIYKVFFETGQAPVCLTFSAHPDNYEEGFSVFEKIVLSFSIVEPDPEKKLID